ncbi:MAG: hypothetical protein J6328_01365 [Bacilli bacterium]|nr:hypothetical protein [Bacilli bacterium]
MTYAYTNRTVSIGLTCRSAEERIQATLEEMSREGWEYQNATGYENHIILFFRREA